MRQLTYVGGSTIEWWDVPEPKLLNEGDALVQPLAITRCDAGTVLAGIDALVVTGPTGINHADVAIVG